MNLIPVARGGPAPRPHLGSLPAPRGHPRDSVKEGPLATVEKGAEASPPWAKKSPCLGPLPYKASGTFGGVWGRPPSGHRA